MESKRERHFDLYICEELIFMEYLYSTGMHAGGSFLLKARHLRI